ncbi:MAG: acyl-ACP thioesterase [Geobacter sp.]|nr:acyl-ACP thioesterase [Geobacter sp.]
MSNPLLERTYDIRPHEVDNHGKLRPVILLKYLQNAASEHTVQLGISVGRLKELGLTWVMSRMHLLMSRYPHRGELLMVRTWPALREGIFSIRDFELLDESGVIIGRATSSWAVLDLESRKPVRIAERLPDYPLHPFRSLEDRFATLPSLKNPESSVRMPVLRSDLDLNQHVNNTIYAGWGVEAAPGRLADSCLPMEIEIGFRAEAHYGDSIVSLCAAEQGDDHCLLHRIEHADSGLELARLRTRWKPVV